MIALIAYYWYGLLIAFAIGLITAWWTWAQLPVAMPIEVDPDDELLDWETERPMPPPAAPSGFAKIATVEDPPLVGEDETAPEEVAPPVPDEAETAHVDEEEAAPAPVSLIEPVEHGVDELTSALSDELAPAIAASSEAAMDAAEPVQDAAETPAEPDVAAVEEPVNAHAEHVGPPEPPHVEEPEPEPVVPAGEAPDDLMAIKGIGPQIDALLRSLGVQRFADIAGWMPEDIERIDGQLGIFKGHIIRDEWIGQARLLAKGDMETFNQRYGHLS